MWFIVNATFVVFIWYEIHTKVNVRSLRFVARIQRLISKDLYGFMKVELILEHRIYACYMEI